MNDNPLVTIGVLSYNSSKTILDTLDSAYKQTYNNIELIVSDDCSSDFTCSIVNNWMQSHKNRFVRCILLTIKQNTGTPSNCNRLCDTSNGIYIKIIAADDILLDNCISDYVSFFRNNQMVKIAYSNYSCFCEDEEKIKRIVAERYGDDINIPFDTDPKSQMYFYLEKGFNISPTVFMLKSLIVDVGKFIEKYKVFEDTPFYLKVMQSGVKIYHLPKKTVLYRVNAPSVTTEKKTEFYKVIFVSNLLQFRKDMVFPLYSKSNVLFWIREFSFRAQFWFTIKVLKNKRTRKNQLIYDLFKALNPYYLLKKIFCK